jgi:putative membrane protein insertion efficiency factor
MANAHPQPPSTGHAPRLARGFITRGLMVLVRGYQLLISPSLPASCRFSPSCSAYSLQALQQHGAWKGSYLTLHRLGRCQPWCNGGHDPVPESVPAPRFFTRFFHDKTAP